MNPRVAPVVEHRLQQNVCTRCSQLLRRAEHVLDAGRNDDGVIAHASSTDLHDWEVSPPSVRPPAPASASWRSCRARSSTGAQRSSSPAIRNLEPYGEDGFAIGDPIPVELVAEGYLVASGSS